MTNSQIVMKALHDATAILAKYVEPGPRDCEATINRLLEVLDDVEVREAIANIDNELKVRSN